MVEGAAPHAIRLWPGLIAAGLLLPIRFLLPIVWPDGMVFAVGGSVLCGLLAVAWWTLFSRAPRADRWGGLALIIAALTATWALADVSMSTGAMGMLVPMLGLPVLGFALVAWAVTSRRLAAGRRRGSMAATIAAACGLLLLVRTDGMTSTLMGSEFHWRWTSTAEGGCWPARRRCRRRPHRSSQRAFLRLQRRPGRHRASCQPRLAPSSRQPQTAPRGLGSRTTRRSSGRGFVDGLATASFAASGLKPIG